MAKLIQLPALLGVDSHAVKCQRCNHMLGIVAPGAYWSRHAARTLLIEGLTEAQRIRVWCESCNKENAVHVA